MNLKIENFEMTERGCFSLAHGLERIVCAIIDNQGFELTGLETKHKEYVSEVQYFEPFSPLRLLDDTRFELNLDFFYKVLEHKMIEKYEIKQIKLKDIKRAWQGQTYSLRECSPYAYLEGNVERYNNYVAENARISAFKMSKERYDALIRSLDEHGFNPKSMPVVNAKNNVIWDGQHRCCYLMHKYGEDHEIDVLCISEKESK